MTIILVAIGLFGLGLGMIAMFRSAVTADDELERKLADARSARAERARLDRDGDKAPGPHGADK